MDVLHSYPMGHDMGNKLLSGQNSGSLHGPQPTDQFPKYPAIHTQSEGPAALSPNVVELDGHNMVEVAEN